MGPTRCTRVALSYKGSEADSKLGAIANNGENIASGGQSKKISNDQELIQSDPTSCPQNQRGNN